MYPDTKQLGICMLLLEYLYTGTLQGFVLLYYNNIMVTCGIQICIKIHLYIVQHYYRGESDHREALLNRGKSHDRSSALNPSFQRVMI